MELKIKITDALIIGIFLFFLSYATAYSVEIIVEFFGGTINFNGFLKMMMFVIYTPFFYIFAIHNSIEPKNKEL
ncbi:hypothetical protein C0583_06700 [Candidatus Parcubacteria bacterium]|nr:MAG: hypothetical protein C0583_06700 [Candidatus Parcubacteria bacterium]